MFVRPALALAWVLSFPAASQSAKPAWAWTIEERIADRTNPAAAAFRLGTASPGGHPVADRFNGRTHPELFLPSEVFAELVEMGFHGDPRSAERMRRALTPQLARHGLPADFWARLRSVSTAYLADAHALKTMGAQWSRRRGLGRARAGRALALKQLDVCRSRIRALTAARAEFGRERFDKFLYEVIAVNMLHVADRLQEPAVLRSRERGCP